VNPSRPRVSALDIGRRGRVYTTRQDISMAQFAASALSLSSGRASRRPVGAIPGNEA